MPDIPVQWFRRSVPVHSYEPTPVSPKIEPISRLTSALNTESPYAFFPLTSMGTEEGQNGDVELFEGKQAPSETLDMHPFMTSESITDSTASISYTPNPFPHANPDPTTALPPTYGTVTLSQGREWDSTAFLFRADLMGTYTPDFASYVEYEFWGAFVYTPQPPGLGVTRTGNVHTFKTRHYVDLFWLHQGLETMSLEWEQDGVTTYAAASYENGVTQFPDIVRTYEGSNGGLRLRCKNTFGFYSIWMDVYLRPVPRVVWTQEVDDPTIVTADASDSFAPTSHILAYGWAGNVEAALDENGDEIEGGVTVVDGEPRTTTPYVRFALVEGVNYLSCRIIDDKPSIFGDTNTSYAASRMYLIVPAESIGRVYTADGAHVLAATGTSGVEVRRLESGYGDAGATPQVAHVPDARRPRLTQHRDGRIVLLSQDKNSKAFRRHGSLDGGATWQ